VNRLALSQDDKLLAGGCWDGSVCVWDFRERRLLNVFVAHDKSIKDCHWRPIVKEHDPLQLVTCSVDGRVCLWDYPSFELVSNVGIHVMSSNACAFGTNTVASASDDWSVRVWDSTLVHTTFSQRLSDCGSATGHILSDDGTRVYVATRDCQVVVYRRGAGGLKKIGVLAEGGKTHNQLITGIIETPSAVVLSSLDGTISLWNSKTFELLSVVTPSSGESACSVLSMAYSPRLSLIAACLEDCTVAFLSSESLQVVMRINPYGEPVLSCAFSNNGDKLAVGSRDGRISVYKCSKQCSRICDIKAHNDWVNYLVWSPDDTELSACSSDFTLTTWVVSSGKQKRVLRGHEGAVTRCCYLLNGTVLASSGTDGTLRLWNVRDDSEGSLISSVKLHASSGGVLSMTPRDKVNCSRLLTLGEDGVVRFVTTMKPAELARLTGHGGPVRHIAFSPNNANILASASDDGTVKVWDWTRERQQRESLQEQLHNGSVVSTVITPDGSLFATVSNSGDVKFWHTNSASGNISTVQVENGGSPVCAVFCSGTQEFASRLYIDCDDNSLHCIDVPATWASSSSADPSISILQDKQVMTFDTSIRNMSVAPNGVTLYICKAPNRIVEFSTQSNTVMREITCVGSYPLTVAPTPSGVYVAFSNFLSTVGGRGSTMIPVCGTSNVSCMLATTLPGHPYLLLACLWDGRVFAVENGKGKYGIPKFKPLKPVPIICAAFAPNERHLIVGRRDSTVAVIDTKTWREVATFVCSSPVTSVAVSRKSQFIIAGDSLGKVYLLKYFRR